MPQIDELEYTIVPDTNRLVSAFAAENGNRFVFINAESDEESVQEELMGTREEYLMHILYSLFLTLIH